jgi:hypothetical protein
MPRGGFLAGIHYRQPKFYRRFLELSKATMAWGAVGLSEPSSSSFSEEMEEPCELSLSFSDQLCLEAMMAEAAGPSESFSSSSSEEMEEPFEPSVSFS